MSPGSRNLVLALIGTLSVTACANAQWVATTRDDPDWVVAASCVILRKDVCYQGEGCAGGSGCIFVPVSSQQPCECDGDVTFWKPDYECDYFSLWEAWSPTPPYGIPTLSFYVRSGVHFQYGDLTGWSGIVTGPQYFVADNVYGCWELEPGTILLPVDPYSNEELNNYYLYFPCDTPAPASVAPERAPAQDDRTFIYDPYWPEAYSHDTLEFDIPVSRYAGKTDPENPGSLLNVESLIENELIGRYATLSIMCWDVDSANPATGLGLPEMDIVYFNGELVSSLDPGNAQYLEGADGQWRLSTFRIPIEKVLFPNALRQYPDKPDPQLNHIRIEIDTGNAPKYYRMAVDWASLTIQAMSPIVLVHGVNSNGRFFVDRGFTRELDDFGLPWDNRIALEPESYEYCARQIAMELYRIAREFGVDGVHLICHSKGGLDARGYLQKHYSHNRSELTVLSFTTLGSPHDGSVLADMVQARRHLAEHEAYRYVGFPAFTGLVASTHRPSNGYGALTVANTWHFNLTNLLALPRDIVYSTVAGNIDVTGNAHVDVSPIDEFSAVRAESTSLRNAYGIPIIGPQLAEALINSVYLSLRGTYAVDVTAEDRILGRVLVIRRVPSAVAVENDILVPIASALGAGSGVGPTFDRTVSQSGGYTYILSGTEGRNHASIADEGVAALVVPWIREVERANGDLQAR